MKIVRVTIWLSGLLFVAACSDEIPPVSVTELMENPRLLEATTVRCAQNRAETKYQAECVNARDAINRLQRAEERTRRVELERQSERKRRALRSTQEAAAAARRRAQEDRLRREEAEYLGLFEQLPATGNSQVTEQSGATAPLQTPASNAPIAEISPAPEADAESPDTELLPADTGSDLDAVREELRRRQQSPDN